MATEFSYNDYVVVAHDEWKLESSKQSTTKFSAHLGGFEWRVAFAKQCQLALECVELKEGTHSDDVHVELFIYGRQNAAVNANANYELWSPHGVAAQDLLLDQPVQDGYYGDEDYYYRQEEQRQQQWQQAQQRLQQQQNINKANKKAKVSYPNPMRAVFTNKSGDSSRTFTFEDCKEFVALNVRILKDRPLLHDFTVNQSIGHVANDLTLLVGQQKFYVNKKMLELVSLYFYRMFNNPNFVEASKDVVDTGETDVALFHDFLLTINPTSHVMPNSKNLAGLLRLAQYYGVDSSVFEKFERSIKLCREMPLTERIMLAKKYAGKQFNLGGILNELNSLNDTKRICMALFKADD